MLAGFQIGYGAVQLAGRAIDKSIFSTGFPLSYMPGLLLKSDRPTRADIDRFRQATSQVFMRHTE